MGPLEQRVRRVLDPFTTCDLTLGETTFVKCTYSSSFAQATFLHVQSQRWCCGVVHFGDLPGEVKS